jgi:hypothetical protein
MDKIIIPEVSKDGDSRDSSLIVYTITVAISIALFVLVMTIDKKNIYSFALNILSAIILSISIIKTFLAIEYLVDITSFGHNQDKKERVRKYKKVLNHYNWSIILIISSIVLILLNYTVKYLVDFINTNYKINLNYFDSFNKCKFIIDILICIIAFLINCCVTKKWFKDIRFLNKPDTEFLDKEKNNNNTISE